MSERVEQRTLSEISENEDLRRMSARVSSYSSTVSLKGGGDRLSRPTSEHREDSKRVSVPVHTITLNLSTYTGSTTPSPAPPLKVSTAVASPGPTATTPVTSPTLSNAPASPAKRKSLPPPKPEKPATLSARPSLVNITNEAKEQPQPEEVKSSEQVAPESAPIDVIVDLSETAEGTSQEAKDGISPLLMATRAALRPAPPLGCANEAYVVPPVTPTVSVTDSSRTDSSRTSIDSVKAPTLRAKPSWLRRASMTQSLGRSKSRSPANLAVDLPPEPSSPHFSTATPPALPPRKFPAGPMDVPTAGPSRPPQHHARENVSHHSQSLSGVGRRWTRTSGSSNNNVTRSSSNTSISTSPSGQYLASSAQRVLGHAGNAVSKTWMRARGVGSSMSISGMTQVRSNEHEPSSPGHLSRKLSRDTDFMPSVSGSQPDAFMFGGGVVKRQPREGKRGLVFGRDLGLAGRACGVFDAAEERPMEGDYQRRRRQCLPAVAIRCVEYLELWGPKEEGIFRISGRSSHIARLRREFDAGADLDLTLCEPCDLDPHAISGIYKSFLRDLPESMLMPHIEQRVDEYLFKRSEDVQELVELLGELPSANWFLLADVVMLIDLIPRHADINRMSYNALMISLGPTLRLSGDHVALFVRHREQLFANPPSVSPRDLVDFGDEEIPPLSPMYEELTPTASTFKRPAPRVSKKPSFGTLLGAGRSSTMRKSQSEQALSTSPVPPPRLDLPDVEQVELPTFTPEVINIDPDETEELNSLRECNSTEGPSPSQSTTDFIDESHYAPGTVAQRSRVYSTPIADRFRSSTASVDTRGHGHTSGAWSVSSLSSFASSVGTGSDLAPPHNPLLAIRRSPPVFFQSNSGGNSSSSSKTGVKRKDDAGAERTREGDVERDSAKRLSFGPTLDDDEAMVTAE